MRVTNVRNCKEENHHFSLEGVFQRGKKIQGSRDGMFVTAKVTDDLPSPPAAGRSLFLQLSARACKHSKIDQNVDALLPPIPIEQKRVQELTFEIEQSKST